MRALGTAAAAALGLLALGVACAPAPKPGPRPVVLVVVDTLRADRLALEGWISRGRRYERAFATSPWTLPSFGSIYTGQIPSRHGAGEVLRGPDGRDFTRLDDDQPTLAELLLARGFATAAIVGNAALSPSFGVARGFQVYDYAPTRNDAGRRADEVVDRAVAWTAHQAGAPFFLLVHLFDPHMDYDAPPPFRGRLTRQTGSDLALPVREARKIAARPETFDPADRAFVAAAYDEEVAFTEAQLARLLDALESQGVLDRGLVILTSDHGEELFDHGGFEHGHALWEELVRLPLVFFGRDVRAGRESTPVSLVDLLPTVLEANGVDVPEGLAGRSLWPNLTRGEPLSPRPLFLERTLYGPERKGVIRWPHKLVWNSRRDVHHLYDLERDPEERHPLRDEPALSAELQRVLHDGIRAADEARQRRSEAVRTEELEPETLEALRELGYAE